MYEVILRIHSLTPYLFLLLMLAVIGMAFMQSKEGNFSNLLKNMARVALLLAHIQLLIGIIMLFMQRAVYSAGMSGLMGDSVLRLKYVEHPFTMILAVILITIGFSKSKRAQDTKGKRKFILLFYTIGLLLILLRIPYQAWLN